ncbi:MAG: Flp family type IVb pilin [Acidimicrobiia bacterium]|nr:Flp family type IVb pilin [Microthrixaceae bacterium]MCB9374298.1 Flp family type IVb pilin [Microthrixaceae bacterium]MCB9399994.1 Flp family type IVb pilin [Microthrixaceae bacterium]MCC6184937.1 Flp family type IVb pilin [Microthrixaceae bacterium]RTL08016.1 MAG: Flp family type IVb pilin [Acidimicrobiia bacterium]
MVQFDFLKTWLKAQAKTERGASLVEYALLVALIAVVCIAAVSFIGSSAKSKFSEVGNSLK